MSHNNIYYVSLFDYMLLDFQIIKSWPNNVRVEYAHFLKLEKANKNNFKGGTSATKCVMWINVDT